MLDWILSISLVKTLLYGFAFSVVYSFVTNKFIYKKCVKDFKGKHVLITGGSAGLGKALAIKISKFGGKVTIIARNQTRLEKAKQEIDNVKQADAKTVAISADISNAKDIDRAIQEAVKQQGEIDILIANAGSAVPTYFLDTPIEVYEREVQLNYLGTLYTVKSALPSLMKSKGHVVFVSSAIIFNSFIGYSNYSATKMALKGLADSLRNEFQLYDIGVTLFAPANIDTEGFAEENKTKPKETKEIEGASPAQHPDVTADYLITGLKEGTYCITNEFFPSDCLRAVCHPLFAPRRSMLLDMILTPIFVFLSPLFTIVYDGIVQSSKKANASATKKTQ